ncbi:Inner kinetochore subunit [Lachnellula occidentalis]|uniref:CENP-C homolog n=1 Tax=Lachnellula occidentalis TaxID=215460 RepID=A0A8H8U9N3_9HELO|nr:Inner kinetochore subunit [Lachnellula occidentalis]
MPPPVILPPRIDFGCPTPFETLPPLLEQGFSYLTALTSNQEPAACAHYELARRLLLAHLLEPAGQLIILLALTLGSSTHTPDGAFGAFITMRKKNPSIWAASLAVKMLWFLYPLEFPPPCTPGIFDIQSMTGKMEHKTSHDNLGTKILNTTTAALFRSEKRAFHRRASVSMAPNGTAALPKRKPTENQYLFDLGKRGRKTGLTLPDKGIRDENGFEPIDDLFSSPAKPFNGRTNKMDSVQKNVNGTISSEEDMDEGESTIPEPEQVLEKRASIRLPPPRSKSPIKTFLQSPARRNPSIGPVSSPTRGTIVAPRSASVSASVRRTLNFSNDENSMEAASATKKRAGSALPHVGRLTNGTHLQTLKQPLSSDNGVEEEEEQEEELDTAINDDTVENGEDSFQFVNSVGEDDFQMVDAQDDAEAEPQGAEPGENDETCEEESSRRPKKAKPAPIEEEEEQPEEPQEEQEPERPAKRARRSLDKAPEAPKANARPKKTAQAAGPAPKEPSKKAAGKSRQSGEASNASKAKVKAPKPALATISEDSPAVKRGPPLPRNNRGLIILRRETPALSSGFNQTRSGRNSMKPLAFWRNERVEYATESQDEIEDSYGKFLLPRIKEVLRTDEIDERKPHRPKSKAKPSKGKKRAEPEPEDEEEVEPWETSPGRIEGLVRDWDPEDPTGQDTGEGTQEIALSSAAIITQVVKDGSFKFAKTLTLPFFGSGILDFRPGDKKRAKCSRKMQMVFFVHYGRVQVTINEENAFRIGKGGMFQVPRGNFYSIENDYEQPARIFFGQGCEVEVEEAEEEVTQQ